MDSIAALWTTKATKKEIQVRLNDPDFYDAVQALIAAGLLQRFVDNYQEIHEVTLHGECR